MRKTIIYTLLALGLTPALGMADTPGLAATPDNLIVQKADEKPGLALNGRNIVRLEVGDRCFNCQMARGQIQRLAPGHPDLVFVISDTGAFVPRVTVLTSELDAQVGHRIWQNIGDDEANKFFDERADFARKELVIEKRMTAIDRQIEAAVAPHAKEIASLNAQIADGIAQVAGMAEVVLPESLSKRILELQSTPEVIAKGSWTNQELQELQKQRTDMEFAVDALRRSVIQPLEAKIEELRQQAASSLIEKRAVESYALQLQLYHDRAAGDMF